MPTPFQHLVPGDPFPHSARFWNPVLDAAKRSRDGANPSPSALPGTLSASQAIVVYIKNTTGAAVGRNCPLKIDGIEIAPADNEASFRDHPIFHGIAPTDDSTAKIVITIEPIADGEIGQAIVSGASVVTIDVTDTSHAYAAPAASNVTNLVSSASNGFPILYAPADVGSSLAAVLLGSSSPGGGNSMNMVIGRAEEDVHNDSIVNSTFNATVVDRLLGNVYPGEPMVVRNLDMGTISGVVSDNEEYVFALMDGMKFIAIQCEDGEWQIIQSGGVLEDYSWYSSGGGGGPVEP